MTFNVKEFDEFVEKMKGAITEHQAVYGNSWETTDLAFLKQRVFAKHNEYKLTSEPRKLISLANLVMMLYVRENNVRRE